MWDKFESRNLTCFLTSKTPKKKAEISSFSCNQNLPRMGETPEKKLFRPLAMSDPAPTSPVGSPGPAPTHPVRNPAPPPPGPAGSPSPAPPHPTPLTHGDPIPSHWLGGTGGGQQPHPLTLENPPLGGIGQFLGVYTWLVTACSTSGINPSRIQIFSKLKAFQQDSKKIVEKKQKYNKKRKLPHILSKSENAKSTWHFSPPSFW